MRGNARGKVRKKRWIRENKRKSRAGKSNMGAKINNEMKKGREMRGNRTGQDKKGKERKGKERGRWEKRLEIGACKDREYGETMRENKK